MKINSTLWFSNLVLIEHSTNFIFIWTSYSIIFENHTRVDWSEKNKKKEKKNKTSEVKIVSTLCFLNFWLNI